MTPNSTYLIDQLDASLAGEINPEFESDLRGNKEMADEWNTLQLALEAIHVVGLQDQVAAIADEYRSARVITMRKPLARSRPLFGTYMKIAASIFLLVTVGGIYKYSSVSSSAFYNKNFSDYELSVSRGSSGLDPLEKAYQEKNWKAVIDIFNRIERKTNKSIFLTAMANLEMKQPAHAINLFSEVLKNNATGQDELFHDESEYYLALSYIANRQTKMAVPILEKIKADKNHTYNQVVNNMSWTDLRIIEYKGGK